MNNEKDFLIPFVGLKLGKHHYDFHIEKDFIKSFGYDDFDEINVNVTLELNKKATHLELIFDHNGFVTLPCDVTNEVFDLPLTGQLKLIVKFGEEYNDDNEDMLILPFSEFQIDVKQYLYEMIVLSIPVKRIHPDIVVEQDDEDELDFLDEEDLDFLESIDDDDDDFDENDNDSDENESAKQNDIIDPRWEKLKQLLTDK